MIKRANFCLIAALLLLLCSCVSTQESPLMLTDYGESQPAEVSLPILGEKMTGYENNSCNMVYPYAVTIREESVLSLTRLADTLEICWYLDGDFPNCAYRRQDGAWMCFLKEDSMYRDGFGAALYHDLFGYSGFYIIAPRGAAYCAYDYYYFNADGELELLLMGLPEDAISDFNGDGKTELLSFYHAGRFTTYYYAVGDDLFMFDIIDALTTHFVDWEYICADPLSLRDDTWFDAPVPENVNSYPLLVTYQYGGKEREAQIRFTQSEILVLQDAL